ncbi:MAG: polysaccharide biosynthesis protein [Gammaproteobacteria bacterium]
MSAVLVGVTQATLLLSVLAAVLAPGVLTIPVLLIFWGVCVLYVGGSRFAVRTFLQRRRRRGERVAIYGAGGAGARLGSALIGGQEFLPVAFVDDSAALQGSVINGIEVFGPEDLLRLVRELEITRVLLALPSVSRRRRKRIIERLEALQVHVQTMPNFSDVISGQARVDDICDVDVADLLGRDSVPPDNELLQSCIRDKVVLVSGAGGSIGSELCRQIVTLGPKRLLLFDHSELALYNINRELKHSVDRDSSKSLEIVPLLGSALDRQRMTSILRTFAVQSVYHAAAYKHVPIVEQNILQGLRNNVAGTYRTAMAAQDAGVDNFVLISTDKAVCPTNVMGASKRLAEMVLQGLHERGSTTRFCMVRFGNVLESSGSVVPLFREQIHRGGPVTVTHPEITRFFMTIPEAAQLVLQAGALSKGGEVFVLDMGKPVKIDDLARRMVHLMGLTVVTEKLLDGDIEIQYTGLRHAEKLYEELLIGDDVERSEHPMILRAQEKWMPWDQLQEKIDQLEKACEGHDCSLARQILRDAVEEYVPSADLVDLVWMSRNDAATVARPSKVSPLSSWRQRR